MGTWNRQNAKIMVAPYGYLQDIFCSAKSGLVGYTKLYLCVLVAYCSASITVFGGYEG